MYVYIKYKKIKEYNNEQYQIALPASTTPAKGGQAGGPFITVRVKLNVSAMGLFRSKRNI